MSVIQKVLIGHKWRKKNQGEEPADPVLPGKQWLKWQMR